jgi:hypothetical protein
MLCSRAQEVRAKLWLRNQSARADPGKWRPVNCFPRVDHNWQLKEAHLKQSLEGVHIYIRKHIVIRRDC